MSISPADMVRFFDMMDSLIPREFRDDARRLLSGVAPSESGGGIPAAERPRHWQVYFKGGWRLTGDGQFGRLERRHCRIAIAGVTPRLLGR